MNDYSFESLIVDAHHFSNEANRLMENFEAKYSQSSLCAPSMNRNISMEFHDDIRIIKLHLTKLLMITQGMKPKINNWKCLQGMIEETATHSVFLKRELLIEKRRGESVFMALNDCIAEKSILELKVDELKERNKSLSYEIKSVKQKMNATTKFSTKQISPIMSSETISSTSQSHQLLKARTPSQTNAINAKPFDNSIHVNPMNNEQCPHSNLKSSESTYPHEAHMKSVETPIINNQRKCDGKSNEEKSFNQTNTSQSSSKKPRDFIFPKKRARSLDAENQEEIKNSKSGLFSPDISSGNNVFMQIGGDRKFKGIKANSNPTSFTPESLIGKQIKKKFGTHGTFVGVIQFFKKPYYRVHYPEDNDIEDLRHDEIVKLLLLPPENSSNNLSDKSLMSISNSNIENSQNSVTELNFSSSSSSEHRGPPLDLVTSSQTTSPRNVENRFFLQSTKFSDSRTFDAVYIDHSESKGVDTRKETEIAESIVEVIDNSRNCIELDLDNDNIEILDNRRDIFTTFPHIVLGNSSFIARDDEPEKSKIIDVNAICIDQFEEFEIDSDLFFKP